MMLKVEIDPSSKGITESSHLGVEGVVIGFGEPFDLKGSV
jgi:hypothetical protein